MVFEGEDLAESLRLAADWIEESVGNYEIYSIEAIGISVVIYREV
jgi:hypothetical protein